MCGRLAELRQAMAAYAAGFDAGLLTGDDAARARDHAAAIEHVAATLKALAAARVAEGPRWRDGGGRSAAHELAAATGTSVNDARDTLELGRRLAEQPEVSAAARAFRVAATCSMAAAWSRARAASSAGSSAASKPAAQAAIAWRSSANRPHMLAVSPRGRTHSDQGQPRATGENVCSMLLRGCDE